MEPKYLDDELIGTSNGFWYDISDGGYIIPSEVLVDQERAKQLADAIQLLMDWEEELREDEKLNDL